MHRLEHRRVRPRRIDVSAAASPILHRWQLRCRSRCRRRGCRYDNVESIGVGDEEHRRCIDVLVIRGHVIEF